MTEYGNMQNYHTKFLEYLDSFYFQKKISYQDFLQLLCEINSNFELYVQTNELQSWPSYILSKNEIQHYSFLTNNSNYINNYLNYKTPITNNLYNSYQLYYPYIQQHTEFNNNQWYNQYFKPSNENHLIDKESHGTTHLEKQLIPPVVPKSKLHIDVNIQEFKDLLSIIDSNPYSPDVECNIDLKALHNIKTELKQIDEMIGLKQFKNDLLDQLLYFIQNLHINVEHDYKHLAIYGPPGTGKTQVAKLVGTMYSKLGILKNGIFKKVTRNDLVAGYLGQTAIKTSKVIQECLGGVLFIDEVYSLGCGAGGGGGDDNSGGEGGDSYSKECIDTLCEALSNHKDDLMVIIAGYEKDVQQYFFKINPGLPSRFIWRFTIDEYSAEELMQIFIGKVEQNGWKWGNDTFENLKPWFIKKHSLGAFKFYGRDMEQLFTYSKISHGRRIYGCPIEERKHLTIADLDRGFELFLKHADESQKNKKKLPDSYYGLYL